MKAVILTNEYLFDIVIGVANSVHHLFQRFIISREGIITDVDDQCRGD